MAGSCHADAYRRLASTELAAIYSDHIEADYDAIREACGPDIPIFTEFDRFLGESGIEIVSICTLPDLHAAQIVAAARAGKHIVAEKPICVSAAELEQVREAVQAAGVQFTACFQETHYGAFLAAIDMVEQGLLGRVHLAEVDYFNGLGPWAKQYWWTRTARHGVSSMVNCGCHAMMLLTLVMGGEMPEEVMSYRAHSAAPSFAEYEFAPTQTSLFRYAGGRIGKVTSCLDAMQPYTFRLSLAGSEGGLIDDRFYSRRIAGLERTRWSTLGARSIGDASVIDGTMYTDFLSLFLETLRTGTTMPRTGLDMAYRMHIMLFAADRSAKSGRPEVLTAELSSGP